MRTLERAMNSEHEELAARYAAECARTLLAYYRAEFLGARNTDPNAIEQAWSDHKDAVDRFERTFPQIVDWRELVEPALLEALEGNRP